MNDLFSLAWGEFSSNIAETYRDIRKGNELNDVTLVCDDGEISAHKLVLYGGSTFFRSVLTKIKHQHPLLYIKGVKINHLEAIVDFIYNGEVNVAQDDLEILLEIAKDLKVKGLSEKRAEGTNENKNGAIIKESGQDLERLMNDYNKQLLDYDVKDTDQQKIQADVEDKFYENYDIEHFDIDGEAEALMERVSDPNGTHIWRCKICSKDNSDKARIRRHVKSNHIKKTEPVKQEAKYSISFKEGENVFGTEDFQSKVLTLMDKEEGLDNKVTWSCKECKKSASDKSRIRKHVEQHISGLVFECIFCEVRSGRSSYLDNHVLRHHSK